ncbi:HNH endonuclease [Nocardia carnea]|uniref:HNH endonuclease n=1 Tax=Nocardia carnea TaxID=37328 RepID=UPI0024545F97|nr:HNH endonuclease signature motif containing protein [Nocardia carnea]
MIGAAKPTADDAASYAVVAKHRKDKGESRPIELTSEVFARYSSYLHTVFDPVGPAVDPLISAADQSTLRDNEKCLTLVHFDSLRSAILKSVRAGKCAYCHQLRATEVDHYLPKSRFGEFSVYSPNLVPICRKCNGIKLNRYRLTGGGRRYLHPYFDNLREGSVQFLNALVVVDQVVTVEFGLIRPAGMSSDVWKVLRHQFEELNLAVRYMEDAAETIAGMVDVFYSHFDGGGAVEISRQLNKEKVSRERVYGPNHWWPVTLGALARSSEFCEGGFTLLGDRDAEIYAI